MKIIAAAFALALASPAFAQTAPAAQPADHSQHQQGQHQDHQQGTPHGQGHGEGCACCADHNGNGRMDCCENMGQAGQRQPAPAQPQSHQNH
ncbi:hypothetical protein [Sphingosinicella sp.]|uniref:hypothetical protein n=1 Tax=Sphingosinicella sp. TaxID=1917971 RepID=UPI004037A1E3